MMRLEDWFAENAGSLEDLLRSIDDDNRLEWQLGFAARHRAWIRQRDEDRQARAMMGASAN